jgi:hypothetical protein
MKIRHSVFAYLIPIAIIAIAIILIVIPSNSNKERPIIGYICIGIIALLIMVRIYSEYLEYDRNSVNGATGLIKRKSMSIPLANVSSCMYEARGIFNTITIQSASGTFIFSNMSNGKKFVNSLNNEIGSIHRNTDTVNAIKDGFESLKK